MTPRPRPQRGLLEALFLSLICFHSIGLNAQVSAAPPRNLTVSADISSVNTLKQNWTDAEGSWFYNVPQGSRLIPYDWFLNLEQVDSQAKFRDAEHMRALGYLTRTADSQANPDGLPIGFVKDGAHLGLTCAACHTAQINYQGRAWLIDGAPTLGDIEKLHRRLVDALEQTARDDAKFARFANAVLGEGADEAARAALRAQVQKAVAFRKGYHERNFPGMDAPPFGPGRVDAFGAIMNEVAETFAQAPNNHAAANAPVSYPFLWDTPQHDHVQWNGSAENKDLALLKPIIGTAHVGALGRNVGEVLGVFGTVDTSREGSLLQLFGYSSSVNKKNLIDIEELLRKLWSPAWPGELPAIDEPLRAQGETLFKKHCQSCHAAIQRDAVDRRVTADMRAVGTDQTMAANFAQRMARSGVLEGRRFAVPGLRKLGPREPVKDLLVHVVQKVVLRPSQTLDFLGNSPEDLLTKLQMDVEYPVYAEIKIDNKRLTGAFNRVSVAGKQQVEEVFSRQPLRLFDNTKAFRQDLSELEGKFVALDGATLRLEDLRGVQPNSSLAGTRLTFKEPATIQYAYKGRPLNGIWATAPYLHNGSVPNLDELLKPASKRVKKFRVGSREFDPDKVGFQMDQGDFQFDTTLPGNSNAGHEYDVEFTVQERKELVEYMKSL
jgi:mono/diheme cytochrome c family protein